MRTDLPGDSTPDNALDADIQALLAVEPSPEFVARVRARIEHTPRPSRLTLHSTFAVAGALAAVVMVLGVMLLPIREANPVEKPTVARIAAEREVEPAPAVVMTSPIRPKIATKAAVRRPRAELVIAANEAAALRRLLNGPLLELPAGVSVPATMELQLSEIEIPPLGVPAPITIEPIEMPAPLTDGAAKGQGAL
jgi:hypothetical protein